MANGNFKLGKLQLLSSTALTKQAAVFGALGLAFGASSAHALDANALPEGGNVVGGAAAISQSGSAMNINQSTDRTVIDWRSFNIGSSATVDFVQPGASSIAVNRVNSSSNPSDIQGSLTANGQVWILNPNGVLFGKTAKIDVAGIVASTGNINKDAFMRGDNRLQFTGADGGSVINDGLISVADGGLAAFVAPYVRNSGVIRARVGKVTLAAGTTFTLDLAGDDLIELGLGADQAMVDQSGELLAAGSIVNLTAKAAGQIVDSVINVSGTVLASGVTEKGGQIILTADNITTTDGAVLAADGGTNGDGGTVYAYADKTGNYSGSFSAKGGSASGDGGFVETSGKKVKIAEGISVDTTAANGAIGDWSIDPDDLEVVGSGTGTLSGSTNDETSTISAATVVAGLNSTNVILQANNSITVSEAITSTATGGGVGNLALNDQDGGGLEINLNAKITLGTGKTLSGQGTTVNVGSAGSIQNGVDVATAGGATVNVAAGDYDGDINVAKQGLTLTGSEGAVINVIPTPGTALNGINITANDVTVQGFDIAGEIVGSYLDYAFDNTVSRGIFVHNGVTNFNVTNNTLHDLRTGVVIDGRNTGSLTNNVIDNTKSAVSVQYTDAGVGNTEGYSVTMTGNSEGQYGNEWGVNVHLNGHEITFGGALANNATKIATDATEAVQAALLANSAANGGWTVQDQGYSYSNRTHVYVGTTGSASNQGSPRGMLDSIADGVRAVVAGGKVLVGAGNFALGTGQLNINKALTLTGAGEDQTNISTTSTGYGIAVTGNDVTLSDFTFNANPTGTYAIKVYPKTATSTDRVTNFAINDVTIDGSKKTALDLHAAVGVTIDNVTVTNTTGGNGIALTDSADVTITNTTTSNNAWGGLALYQTNRYYDQQVTNISVDTSNDFGESNPVYLEDESDGSTAYGGASGLDFGTLDIQGFDFAAHNTDASDFYSWLQKSVEGAANQLQAKAELATGYVTGWTGAASNGSLYVGHTTDETAMSINAAVNAAASGATISVDEGDYAGTVIIDKGIALQGSDSVNRANLTDGIQLTGAYSDLILRNLVVSGDGGGNKVVSGGSVTNLTVDNVKIDGGNVDNRFGFAGGKTYGDISITNSQFVNINGWAAFDNSTGGSATALTSVNFSNNLLDNVQGHIAFRQLNATDVTISGNTVRNTGSDTNSFGGIFKVFKGGTVDFEGNTVSDIGTSGFNPAGEAAYGAVLLTREVTTLNVTDNIFTNNNQVLAVEPGKALPGTTNISGNTFTNNGYAIYTPTNISGGGTINFSGTNNFIAGVDTVQHIVWRSASALDLTGVQFDGKLGSAMTNAELFAVEDLITHGMDSDAAGLATVKADNVYVTSTGSIARGVAKVAAGDTVNVDGGTFALGTSQLNINKSLTLLGAGEGVTNISTTSAGYGISVTANDVTLSDFTFNGNPSGSYGIKVSPGGASTNRLTNFAISNVSVDGSYRTGLDLNGVNGATIDNVNVTGVAWGNGISLTDSANVIVTNSTTSGNAWGGLAIYQANRSYDQQVNNITIDETNSFGEANPVYMQDESDGSTAHGGANGLDIGTVNIAGFTLAGHNTDASDKYTYLNNTVTALADWLQVKGQLVDGYVTGWTGSAANNEFFVGHATDTTAMSIASAQANSATGNTINVGSGSFAEDVVVADARVFKFDGSTLNSYTQSVASSIGGTVTSVGGFVMSALTNLVSDTTLNGAVTAQSIAGVGSDLNVNGGATVLNGASYQAASLNFNGSSTTLTGVTTAFNTALDNGDITFTGPIFGTTTDVQNVSFNAGAGDISLQNAGTNSVWLGNMSATGNDFSAATVYANSFFSALTGNQTFTTDTLHTKGAVTSTVGGNATGPINSGGNVNINAGGAFNGNVAAPTTTVSGSTVTGTFTGTTANLTAGNSLNVTTNVTTLNVNAPSGTVNGTYTTLGNTGGPLIINGKTVQGNAPTNPNQIVVEGFTLPAGAFVTSSGEIILPSGMMVGLVSPAAGPGASGGKPKVVIVHNVHMLGQLLSEGYVAIIVDLSKDSDEMEELAMN